MRASRDPTISAPELAHRKEIVKEKPRLTFDQAGLLIVVGLCRLLPGGGGCFRWPFTADHTRRLYIKKALANNRFPMLNQRARIKHSAECN
jgi:hypothetical protein